MSAPDIQTCVARIVVIAALYLTEGEREQFEPEINRLVRAFNKSPHGKWMPLSSYAFAGDQSTAMRRFLADVFCIEEPKPATLDTESA